MNGTIGREKKVETEEGREGGRRGARRENEGTIEEEWPFLRGTAVDSRSQRARAEATARLERRTL